MSESQEKSEVQENVAKKDTKKDDGMTQDKKPIYRMKLERITGSSNPREETDEIYKHGYKLTTSETDENGDPLGIIQLATSADIDHAKKLVDLMNECESTGENSIVSLATDIMERGQLQTIAVRDTKRKNGTFDLIFGGRRTAAVAYAYALSRTQVENGERKKSIEPIVRVELYRVNEDEAFDMSVRENILRKDFTPFEEGKIYAQYRERRVPLFEKNGDPKIDPKTGEQKTRKMSFKDVGKKFGKHEATVRNHAILTEATPEQRQKVEDGKMTLTGLTKKLLGEEHYNDGSRVEKKRRALTLKQIQKLFDLTCEGDSENVERLSALAECMQISLDDALAEADDRIEDPEEPEEPEEAEVEVEENELEEEVEEEVEDEVEDEESAILEETEVEDTIEEFEEEEEFDEEEED